MKIEPLESRIAPAVLFAVDSNNKLASFDSAAPGTLLTDVSITGLQAGEAIAGIDFRPATGELYALGITDNGATRTGRLYTIDLATGAASSLGAPFANNLADTANYGFDFNPTVDRIRVTNDFDANLRLTPNSGALAATDTNLSDANQSEFITGAAYDRNFGGNTTTLYAINFTTSELVRIGGENGTPTPNLGVVTPIGPLSIGGFQVSFQNANVGFDIGGDAGGPELGWLSARIGNEIHIYNVDLGSGALTDLGLIGDGGRLFHSVAVKIGQGSAPTIAVGGKSATWNDLDGDLVTLKITKGTLTSANFRMIDGASGSGLSVLTLSDPTFNGTDVIFSAKPSAQGGDGSVNIGNINATALDLGKVTVPGDLHAIVAGGPSPAPGIAALTVRSFGAVISGFAPAGTFLSDIGGAGKITIAGDLGGTLASFGKAPTLFIGGDIIGGSGTNSGVAAGEFGKVTVKGNVRGGDGQSSGGLQIIAPSLTIGGGVYGGNGDGSGKVVLNTSKPVALAILGNIEGGNGSGSGALVVSDATTVTLGGQLRGAMITTGNVAKFAIGSIAPGLADAPSIIDAKRIGSLAVKGSIAGTLEHPVVIAVAGNLSPTTAAEALAIGKVSIGGDLLHASISAGIGILSTKTADAAIGAVKIGRNMIGSSITAGIDRVDGAFGNGDDAFVGGNNGNAAIIARIASVTIGGQLLGTANGPADSFGILAEQIGSITIGKSKLPLTAGKDNFLTTSNGDVRVREF